MCLIWIDTKLIGFIDPSFDSPPFRYTELLHKRIISSPDSALCCPTIKVTSCNLLVRSQYISHLLTGLWTLHVLGEKFSWLKMNKKLLFIFGF
ncbi:hypothetical protein CW304_21005 [Bacillus sp. UFRGS-B20]|nr:hypothetical protein CW304_21005 [Bacillus sp. UFRGS-B20]